MGRGQRSRHSPRIPGCAQRHQSASFPLALPAGSCCPASGLPQCRRGPGSRFCPGRFSWERICLPRSLWCCCCPHCRTSRCQDTSRCWGPSRCWGILSYRGTSRFWSPSWHSWATCPLTGASGAASVWVWGGSWPWPLSSEDGSRGRGGGHDDGDGDGDDDDDETDDEEDTTDTGSKDRQGRESCSSKS